ncbi:transglycosylase SLT domain-containing protein [Paraperlucidibaca sp.]|jgi:membrane-bound lytic murein transglycosylase D|uniref:transglycosylase SLT domain-containing protein n=1 Tax=Paraperlucidibaca sp. TaxID=2708021 RepID=UPI003988D7F2
MLISVDNLRNSRQPRVLLALLAALFLSACASAPVAKRSYPIIQKQRIVVPPQPMKPIAKNDVQPAAARVVVTPAPAPASILASAVVTEIASAPATTPVQAAASVSVIAKVPTAAAVISKPASSIKVDNDPALSAPTIILTRSTPAKASVATNQDLVQRLRRGFSMPTRYNSRIDAQFSRYSGQQKYIDELMAKASRFLFVAVAEAERRGLPTELALLPIIESAYDPAATSKSNAAGLWQFIPDTGRLYGLRQTNWVDARRDPLESTRAAYDYLAKLYGMFGDWELVLASYNAGPGTVSRALQANNARGLGDDYWSLKLSAEAMDYVPRFLAVVSMFKDPISAGVSIPAIPNRPYFRTVAAKGSLDLDTVSTLSGVPLDELRILNAALRRDQLAPDGPYLLHVPNYLDIASEHLLVQQSVASDVRVVNASGRAEAVVASVSTEIIRANYIDANSRTYQVRRGDSWFSIARRNQLSATQLAAANDEELSTILDIGRELSIPTPAAAAYQAHVFNSSTSTASREPVSLPRNNAATQVIQAGNRGL